MKVKIFEGRIYSVVKKLRIIFWYRLSMGFTRMMQNSKKAMKARGEKFVGIADKEAVYNIYEISPDAVKENGTLVTE